MKPHLLVLAALLISLAHGADRPNIVILLADDLGWGDVGYHGGRIATPHIDRLAAEGVRLENFHVASLCSPTRAGLTTGRWPIRYGMGEAVITPWRKWGLATTEHTIAYMLAEAGYKRRACVGKWHLGHYQREYLPLQRGFTFFYGHYNGAFDYFTHKRENELDWHRNEETCHDEGYSTDLIGREAARFIEAGKTCEPFFLYVPFNAPHTPFQAKEEDIAKYAGIDNVKVRTYHAMVDSMDQAIGRILGALERKKLAENTCVLFLSDNGGISMIPGSNGNWRGSKGSVYEGGIRVPAVVRWPAGIKGGRKIDGLMGYIDIYPTLQALAGSSAAPPNPLDGINLLPVIRGERKAPQRDWFSYIAQGSPGKLALTDAPWKLVVLNGTPGQADLAKPDGPPSLELFHLKNDPSEKINLLDQHPERAAAMLQRLRKHYSLKIDGIPHFHEGAEGFTAPKDWKIAE